MSWLPRTGLVLRQERGNVSSHHVNDQHRPRAWPRKERRLPGFAATTGGPGRPASASAAPAPGWARGPSGPRRARLPGLPLGLPLGVLLGVLAGGAQGQVVVPGAPVRFDVRIPVIAELPPAVRAHGPPRLARRGFLLRAAPFLFAGCRAAASDGSVPARIANRVEQRLAAVAAEAPEGGAGRAVCRAARRPCRAARPSRARDTSRRSPTSTSRRLTCDRRLTRWGSSGATDDREC